MRRLPIALAMLAATPALAQSNIGLTQYPAPKCERPPAVDVAARPTAPDNPTEAQATIYNAKIRTYNAAMRAHNDGVKLYADCVQGYLAAGKADMQRIQAAMDAAVAIANGQ
jgi:hypothetical protein